MQEHKINMMHEIKMDYKMSASLIAKNKKWTFDSVFSLDKTKVLITDFVTVSIHGVNTESKVHFL